MARLAHITSLARLPARAMCCLFVLLLLAGCGEESNANDRPTSQISRPGDIGLPLDNPVSVEAFDVADRFLAKWFFLKDIDGAMELVHPNVRDSWRPLVQDTQVKRDCSFVQVEGSSPDESGAVTARYAVSGCMIAAPGGLAAVYIELTLTSTEEGPRVTQIEFLR